MFIKLVSAALMLSFAFQLNAKPLDNSSSSESSKNVETYQFNGFNISKHHDIGVCLVTKDRTLEVDHELENQLMDLCGSLEIMILMKNSAKNEAYSFNSIDDDRTFTTGNNTGSINQIAQSLFGVWSFG